MLWKTAALQFNIFLLLCAPIAAQAPTARTSAATAGQFDTLSSQAKSAQQAGDFDKSIGLYATALRLRPTWEQGWWELASIQYKLKHYDLALAAYRRVTVANPRNGAALALAGLCEFNLGQYASALKDIDRGGSLGLGNDQNLMPVVLYHAALLLTRGGDFEQSADQLGMFVAAGNHSPDLVVALGLNTIRLAMAPSEIPQAKRDLVMKAGEAAWQNTSHNVEGARTLFAQLAADYPSDSGAQYAYASYLLDSDPQLAFEEYKKSLLLDPSNIDAALKVAFFNLQQGDPEAAIKLANQALLKSPKDYRAHLVLGRAYLQKSQAQKAILELRRATEFAPTVAETRYYLARAYRDAGNSANAGREQAEFDRLKKEDNSHTSVSGWWYFASQYYGKQRYAEARDALAKILAQKPDDSAAWAMTGLCDFALGEYRKSLEHLTKARSTGLTEDSSLANAVHFYLAELLNQAGKPEAALQELSASSEMQTSSPQIQFVMGLISLRWKLLPTQVPADKQALVSGVGEAARLFNTGQMQEAASKFPSLVATYPAEPNLHFVYGICLGRMGDAAGARREFAQELEVNPSNSDAEAHLALADLKEGSTDEALRRSEAAVKIDPNGYMGHNALGWVALANHDLRRAVEEMTTAVRLYPESAAMHFGLAQALKAAGRQQDANRETAAVEKLRKTGQSPRPSATP